MLESQLKQQKEQISFLEQERERLSLNNSEKKSLQKELVELYKQKLNLQKSLGTQSNKFER